MQRLVSGLTERLVSKVMKVASIRAYIRELANSISK